MSYTKWEASKSITYGLRNTYGMYDIDMPIEYEDVLQCNQQHETHYMRMQIHNLICTLETIKIHFH
jgi:hypothetical protein